MSATINVTTNATDTLNGADGQCSLREAITNINNSATTYADCAPTGDPSLLRRGCPLYFPTAAVFHHTVLCV
jgi:CSLREA domain-containing protein